MLCTYKMPTTVREDLENVRSIRKRAEEKEDLHKKNLYDAMHRCGNVHEKDEEMNFYIDGVLPTTRTIVARFRESERRRDVKFEDFTHFARAECEAARDRLQQ